MVIATAVDKKWQVLHNGMPHYQDLCSIDVAGKWHWLLLELLFVMCWLVIMSHTTMNATCRKLQCCTTSAEKTTMSIEANIRC